jgi:hypothetical protein
MLNSRSPIAKGFSKRPLRPECKQTWENILKSTANYLLSLRANNEAQHLLAMHARKAFVRGFVTTIKSTIEMASEMFAIEEPIKYLLIYKFSQDRIELLFSCTV